MCGPVRAVHARMRRKCKIVGMARNGAFRKAASNAPALARALKAAARQIARL
jgi:hypothetical protein